MIWMPRFGYGAGVYFLVALVTMALTAMPLHGRFHPPGMSSPQAASRLAGQTVRDTTPLLRERPRAIAHEPRMLNYPTCCTSSPFAPPPAYFQLLVHAMHAARLGMPQLEGGSSAEQMRIFKPPKTV